MNREKIHPDFDGHLEQRLRDMSPKEKLLYLSQQIELRHFARRVVKKKKTSTPQQGCRIPGFTSKNADFIRTEEDRRLP